MQFHVRIAVCLHRLVMNPENVLWLHSPNRIHRPIFRFLFRECNGFCSEVMTTYAKNRFQPGTKTRYTASPFELQRTHPIWLHSNNCETTKQADNQHRHINLRESVRRFLCRFRKATRFKHYYAPPFAPAPSFLCFHSKTSKRKFPAFFDCISSDARCVKHQNADQCERIKNIRKEMRYTIKPHEMYANTCQLLVIQGISSKI